MRIADEFFGQRVKNTKKMNTLTCKSFENGNALEAFEVVDENVGNPKVRQEFEAHWVPGILMRNDKSSDSLGSFHKID